MNKKKKNQKNIKTKTWKQKNIRPVFHLLSDEDHKILETNSLIYLSDYLYRCGVDVSNKQECFVSAVNGYFPTFILRRHLDGAMQIAQYLRSEEK